MSLVLNLPSFPFSHLQIKQPTIASTYSGIQYKEIYCGVFKKPIPKIIWFPSFGTYSIRLLALKWEWIYRVRSRSFIIQNVLEFSYQSINGQKNYGNEVKSYKCLSNFVCKLQWSFPEISVGSVLLHKNHIKIVFQNTVYSRQSPYRWSQTCMRCAKLFKHISLSDFCCDCCLEFTNRLRVALIHINPDTQVTVS